MRLKKVKRYTCRPWGAARQATRDAQLAFERLCCAARSAAVCELQDPSQGAKLEFELRAVPSRVRCAEGLQVDLLSSIPQTT
eukprot:13135-Heterococcus_DN1.PRE.2